MLFLYSIYLIWINQLAKLHAFYEMYINDNFLKWMSQGHPLLIFFSLSLLLFKYTSNLVFFLFLLFLICCYVELQIILLLLPYFVFVEVWNTNLIKKKEKDFLCFFLFWVWCAGVSLFVCNYLKRGFWDHSLHSVFIFCKIRYFDLDQVL